MYINIKNKNHVGHSVFKQVMLKQGQMIASGPRNVALNIQNFQALDHQYDKSIEQVFKNSKIPLMIIKQNNVLILSILKNLLTMKFHKKGIFETLWLSLIYWNRVSVESLRKLLNIEQR